MLSAAVLTDQHRRAQAPTVARRRLPTGTVTLVFTDIEGSTRLLQELGDRYGEVLGQHRRVLREAFRRHGGVEVDTQGDAFFYAFSKATDAAAVAREGQAALAAGEVRVRIGIDKPPGREGGADYVLRRPTRAQRDALDVAVAEAADAVEVIALEGVDAAMLRFNGDR